MTTQLPPEEQIRQSLHSNDPSIVRLWNEVCDDLAAKQSRWVQGLRAMGVKAAHPDDGWVDRHSDPLRDRVRFQYPQFNDEPKAGDQIALGSPGHYRVRTVIEILPANIWGSSRYVVPK